MAAEGIRFTHFYAGGSVCSPSRAALLTGRYPTRVGVPRVLFPLPPLLAKFIPSDNPGLADSEVTIAQMLRARKYRTICIGKWHLGHLPQFLPTQRGFDEYYGIPYSNDMSPRVLLHNTRIIEQPARLETLTLQYTEKALQFIKKSREAPFFLYLAHTYPHIPLAASQRFRGQSGAGLYGDVVQELDWSVGEILRTLRELGLDSDTIVMFSSDNGPWYQGSPGKLRGRKATTYEGGYRVPFIVRFPGRIPEDKTCHGTASVMDIPPTLARLCDVPLPESRLDGIDIWSLLSGEKQEIEREALLYFDDVHLQCARWGQWKLHVARYGSSSEGAQSSGGRANLLLTPPELYNLITDPDESYNVAPEHPAVVAEIRGRIDRLMQGFPPEIRAVYEQTKTRPSTPHTPGARPHAAAVSPSPRGEAQHAKAKPNFSGTWKMNPLRCHFDLLPGPQSRMDMIEHREPSLDVVTTTVGSQGRHTLSLHFTTDGNTRVNSVDGAVLESVASWEGSILRIESQLHTNEDEITVLDRWSLWDDGSTLKIERNLSGVLGSVRQLQVLERQ